MPHFTSRPLQQDTLQVRSAEETADLTSLKMQLLNSQQEFHKWTKMRVCQLMSVQTEAGGLARAILIPELGSVLNAVSSSRINLGLRCQG